MRMLLLILAVVSSSISALTAQQVVEPMKIDSPDEILEKFGGQSEGLIHEGDVLTFMFHSDALKANLTTMLGVPFKKNGRDGPWMGQVKVPESDKLLMSFAFTENDDNGWEKLRHHRGPKAPPIPISSTPLSGKHFKYRMDSKHLEEHRVVEVYVPDVEVDSPMPVLYLTDGGDFFSYVGSIDWKIKSGEIQPIVVVAMHSGGYRGNRKNVQSLEFDFRAKEYLAAVGDGRYEMHCAFLTEEVIPFVEKNHNVSSNPKHRALSGYSNGGAYVLTVSIDNPNLFGHVFPYSVAFFDRDDLKKNVLENKGSLPQYRFAAGTLEHFIKGTRASHEILSDAGVDAKIRTYVAGHDPLLWKVALLDDLQAVFPGEGRGQADK